MVHREGVWQCIDIIVRNSDVPVTFWTVEVSVLYAEQLNAISTETVKAWKHFRVPIALAANRTVDRDAWDFFLHLGC